MGRLYTFLLLYLAVAFLQNLYIDLVAIFTAKIHLFINLIDFRLLNDDIFDLEPDFSSLSPIYVGIPFYYLQIISI